MNRAVMYADGGSRGNPGPSASGYVLYQADDHGHPTKKIFEEGVYLGITTNNQAEYTAIILGLRKAHELGFTIVDARLDSELAVKQINRIYKVKNPDIAKRFFEVHEARQPFSKTSFTHIPREKNKEADAMVNLALDEQAAKKI